jgi:hypothetical protein
MARGSVSKKPLDWAAFYERVKLARQLVALGSATLKKAQVDFDLATAGLAEIEAELAQLVREGGAQ